MLSIMQTIHSVLPTALWISTLLVALWGIYQVWQQQELKQAFAPVLIVLQIGIYLQAALGIVLWIAGGWPTLGIWHFVIGTLAAAGLGLLSAFLTNNLPNNVRWQSTAGFVVVFTVTLLATLTG